MTATRASKSVGEGAGGGAGAKTRRAMPSRRAASARRRPSGFAQERVARQDAGGVACACGVQNLGGRLGVGKTVQGSVKGDAALVLEPEGGGVRGRTAEPGAGDASEGVPGSQTQPVTTVCRSQSDQGQHWLRSMPPSPQFWGSQNRGAHRPFRLPQNWGLGGEFHGWAGAKGEAPPPPPPAAGAGAGAGCVSCWASEAYCVSGTLILTPAWKSRRDC